MTRFLLNALAIAAVGALFFAIVLSAFDDGAARVRCEERGGTVRHPDPVCGADLSGRVSCIAQPWRCER